MATKRTDGEQPAAERQDPLLDMLVRVLTPRIISELQWRESLAIRLQEIRAERLGKARMKRARARRERSREVA